MVTANTLIDERDRFLSELRNNKNRFRDFLGAMAAHYRQPIGRQIALFFHAPAAGRAYADEALWQRLGARLQEGAEGVPVLSEDGDRVTYVYDLSETQEAERPQLRRLVWEFDAEKDGEALRKIFGGETEDAPADAVVERMSRLKEQGFGELEVLGATYLVLERLGMDAEEHMGLPLILAHYENVDAELLLGNIQRAAMSVLDPLAKEIRAREQRDEERAVSEYESVFGERDGASDGASEEGAESTRDRGAGERGDLQPDGAVRGDDLSVSGRGAVPGGRGAVRAAESGDDQGGDAAGDPTGADGRWAQIRRAYLQSYHPEEWLRMLRTGEATPHLQQIQQETGARYRAMYQREEERQILGQNLKGLEEIQRSRMIEAQITEVLTADLAH